MNSMKIERIYEINSNKYAECRIFADQPARRYRPTIIQSLFNYVEILVVDRCADAPRG